jgi:hypothetical protein
MADPTGPSRVADLREQGVQLGDVRQAHLGRLDINTGRCGMRNWHERPFVRTMIV